VNEAEEEENRFQGRVGKSVLAVSYHRTNIGITVTFAIVNQIYIIYKRMFRKLVRRKYCPPQDSEEGKASSLQ
jgi:hypothetical protein